MLNFKQKKKLWSRCNLGQLSLSVVVFFTIFTSQSLVHAQGCTSPKGQIYSLEGRVIEATIRMCGRQMTDITSGANAPRRGEIVVKENAKAMEGALLLLRGLPNTSYPVYSNEPYGQLVKTFVPNRSQSWLEAGYTLPFTPTKRVLLGESDNKYWGFSGFVPIFSNDLNANPITYNSVIYSIDGWGFIYPDAWLGFLHMYTASTISQYVRVIYFNLDERPMRFRSALVPLYKTKDIYSHWSNLVQNSDFMRRSYVEGDARNQLFLSAAAAISVVAIMKFYYSGFGQYLDRLCREQQPSLFEECSTDPLLRLAPKR